MNPRRILLPAALAAASVLVLAGCAGADAGGGATDDGRIAVVASTSVYGQIVEEIGGDLVDVTSIVTSTSQDPHSFEPSAQDQLAVSRAALIVENGGGYDAYVDALIEASGSTAPVVTAAELSPAWPGEDVGGAEDEHAEDEHAEDEHGHDHVEGFNEHVWYDPHTVEQVAGAIADELSALRPDDATVFEDNAAAFTEQVAGLEDSLAEIDAAHAGEEIFVTEPVPLYLTSAAGLVNVAPDAFSEAVEEGQDVPPATLLEALDLLRGGSVRLVAANSQTGGAETTAVLDEADALGIPVAEFAETLPDGQTYISWMQANIAGLADALNA